MQTFEYDPTNEASIKRAINLLKSQLGQLSKARTGTSTKSKDLETKLACQKILDTDISSIYGTPSMLDRKDFYVYVHCDPMAPLTRDRGISGFLRDLGIEFRPFYVGKGQGSRYLELSRNETHRKIRQKLLMLGKDVHAQKIRVKLTEPEALALESKLIDIMGLRVTGGMLVNLDEGQASQERRRLYLQSLTRVSKFYRELYEPNPVLATRIRKVVG